MIFFNVVPKCVISKRDNNIKFAVEHSLEFILTNVMNMQPFEAKLNKMLIFNNNKHHPKTIDSCFHCV